MAFDSIIIGGGHNGLAAAITLQKKGKRVLVVEARSEAGGLCAPRKFAEGFSVPGIFHDTHEIRPGLIDSLGLSQAGLKMRAGEVPVFAPSASGKGLLLYRDVEKSAAELGDQVAGYRELARLVERLRAVLTAVLNEAPPALVPEAVGEFVDFAKLGLAVRRLGAKDLHEFLRMATMCMGDLMRDHFKNDLVMATLAQPTIQGEPVGPWSAGTALRFLLQWASAGAEVVGGPAAVVQALLKSFASLGGEVRTGAKVVEIVVEKNQVTGVKLAGGEVLKASLVGSAIHPTTTLLSLLAPRVLPLKLQDQVRAFRSRGCSAKVHLALAAPIQTTSRPSEAFERMRLAESLDELERAYDAVKYREISKVPALDIRQPSLVDDSLCPKGKHVASVWVNFAPGVLDGGWHAAARAAVLENTLARIETFDPAIRSKVEGSEVLDPRGLEADYGALGGNMHGGEMGLDQLLFMRPSLAFAHYTTPVEGLFLCGSGSHPGGGVTLAPGALGAAAALG